MFGGNWSNMDLKICVTRDLCLISPPELFDRHTLAYHEDNIPLYLECTTSLFTPCPSPFPRLIFHSARNWCMVFLASLQWPI